MAKAYIGLDVHKEKIVMGVAINEEEAFVYGRCSSDLQRFLTALRKFQKKYDLNKEDLSICYEAGPCGFVLARHLLRIGYDIIVIAPSLIPKKPGDKVKTDKRDAKELAYQHRSGTLTAVHIPNPDDEVLRDLCRARSDAVDDQKRTKQRLGALLLRNGHHYTGRSAWSESHMRYIRELVMIDPLQKIILEEYLQTLDMNIARVKSLEEHMRLRLESWHRRHFVEALQGFRGFQMVASMVVTSELGDLTRFKHPRQLMNYLGLVPSEYSSGTRRNQGSITKCGNSHVRWMLVEVAQHYQKPPKVSKELSKRQLDLPKSIKELSWRTQNRLYKRYIRLRKRGFHENRIKVAIARELSSFIWELAHLLEENKRAAA